MTKNQRNRAKILYEAQQETKGVLILTLPRAPQSYGRFAPLDGVMTETVSWFHNDYDLIELDRSRPDPFDGRRKYKVAGKLVAITCRRKVSRSTKRELVQDFQKSENYRSVVENLGKPLHPKTIQSCIFFCLFFFLS